MNIASGLGMSFVALFIGFAMVWFGMPNKQGEHPRFLRFGLMQMIYPVTALGFLVVGILQLFLI
jgi:hypothetical protein